MTDIIHPEYALVEIKAVGPDGITDGWGVLHEPSKTLHEISSGLPFIARTSHCALGLVAILNGIKPGPHICQCFIDN